MSLCRSLCLVSGVVAAALTVFAQAPQPLAFKVQLTQPLSTKANQKGDKVVAMVTEPAQYKGSIMEGTVKEVKSGGTITKESVLNFGFGVLHAEGKDIPVHTEITSFYNSKGQANTDEEGRIIEKRNDLAKAAVIGGLGAGIGSIAGGSKGAAIGAGAGAAAGLLFIRFGAQAENIAFDTGSVFDLQVTMQRER